MASTVMDLEWLATSGWAGSQARGVLKSVIDVVATITIPAAKLPRNQKSLEAWLDQLHNQG